ncbi:MAG: O-antigen ligase family protein [Micrococcales bacterium]|nr:O-antigen ligase family protein [Micrococcales bacterium]
MCTLGLSIWVLDGGTSFGLNFWAGWSPWLLSAAFLLFGLTFGPRRWLVWRWILTTLGLLVAVIQDLAILGKALGIIDTETSRYGDFYAMRTVHASLALLIVLAFALVLTDMAAGRTQALLATFLGVSVVLSQHRSVWLAFTIVTALMFARFYRRGAPRQSWIGLVAPLAYLVVANLAPLTGLHLLPRAGEPASERGLADAATSSNSLDWRLEMWRTRLVAPRDPDHWLFGGVLRVNPVKWPGDGVMNPYNSAHNMFVDVSVMLGLAGVVVVVAITVASTLLRSDRLDPLAIFLCGLLGYGMFYYWPSWSWVVVGVALAGNQAHPPDRTTPV